MVVVLLAGRYIQRTLPMDMKGTEIPTSCYQRRLVNSNRSAWARLQHGCSVDVASHLTGCAGMGVKP
jgi:hypothetical protein